jgi:hypothetical protein
MKSFTTTELWLHNKFRAEQLAPDRSDGPLLGRGGRGPRCGSFRWGGVGVPKGGGAGDEAGDRRQGQRATPGLSLGALHGCPYTGGSQGAVDW